MFHVGPALAVLLLLRVPTEVNRMVTWMRASVLMTLALGSLPACSSSVGVGSSDDPVPGPSLDPAPGRYAGHGFVVHEWGTDTIVVGSDGSLQRGLHHEEEDLPSFARAAAGE